MKHLFYLIILSFCIVSFHSCKKADSPAPSNNNQADMATMLNKKWSTGNSTSRTSVDPAAADYVSFEFNSQGQYYIIKADKSLLMGNYTLNTADSIVTLFNGSSTTSQYGTLSISEITATTLIFKLTLPTFPAIDINTTAVTTSVGTSSNPSVNNTAKICKAWKVDTYVVGTATYNIAAPMYAHIVFTENGTYWTETYNGPGTSVQTNSGRWKWSDATQTKICTSSTDTDPVCSTSSGADISFDANGNLITSTNPTGQATNTYYYSILPQ